MKINFNTSIKMLLLPLVCFLFIATKASAQKQDFSGTWKINKEKSDFRELSPNSAAVEIKIAVEEKQISLTRHQVFASGDNLEYTEKMIFDGKTSETKLNNDLTKTSSVKWAGDNRSFTEETTYSDGRKAIENWSLSADSKVLTIQRSTPGDDSGNVIYVYDKH